MPAVIQHVWKFSAVVIGFNLAANTDKKKKKSYILSHYTENYKPASVSSVMVKHRHLTNATLKSPKTFYHSKIIPIFQALYVERFYIP